MMRRSILFATLALAVSGCADEPATKVVQPGIVPGGQHDCCPTIGDRIHFGFDEHVITAEARKTLDKQASWMKRYPNVKVVIEGHADERGTREYNLALGARRAQAMKDYLVAQGVEAKRLKTVSYGKERPEVAESNEAAWAPPSPPSSNSQRNC